jgi:hypothetical protein
MATLIPAHGEIRELVPANGRAFTLAELQAIVGGYIEAIGVPDGRLMFLNEDGKRLQLPINNEATARVRHRLMPGDVIVGDVILCTRRESNGPEDAGAEHAE